MLRKRNNRFHQGRSRAQRSLTIAFDFYASSTLHSGSIFAVLANMAVAGGWCRFSIPLSNRLRLDAKQQDLGFAVDPLVQKREGRRRCYCHLFRLFEHDDCACIQPAALRY